jgi:ADP-ribose pyrophosphatase YjhB (NUDIX family)
MSYFSLQPKYISITKSYGIIPFTIKNKEINFLMIRRKNTFGYIDIIKGKYNIANTILFENLINSMTIEEKQDILNYDFDTLWNKMWLFPTKFNIDTKKKFHSNLIFIHECIKKSTTTWYEPEWEFPKGRKNTKETEINCAKREFTEETGIDSINIISNVIPYDEIYIGSNLKCYKFKYFLAFINNYNTDLSNFQKSEVSDIKWFTYNECLVHIRDYHYEKKNNLTKINSLILSLRLI